MPCQPVHFKNEGGDLFGMLHLPAAPGKRKHFPSVVMLHGLVSTRTEKHRIFVKLSRRLGAEGIASLRFDFRGCGDSSGDSRDLTLASMLSDARAGLEFFLRHGCADPKRLGLLGMSLGGGIAATLAGRDPRIRALALWAPVGNIMESLEIKAGSGEQARQALKLKEVDYIGNILGHEFFSEFELFKPLEAVKNFKGAGLIVQGEKDQTVPAHQSELYRQALKGARGGAKRLLIPGSDHTFASAAWEKQALDETVSFFKKALEP